MPSSTRVVLFDLGGVLVELGGVEELGALVGESDEDEIWRRWLSCPWVRRFERGECTAGQFARGMVAQWDLPLTPDAFLEAFHRWPKGLYPGAAALTAALEGHVLRACFSNTNAFHIGHQLEAFGLLDLFDRHFFSNEIGLVKPDAEAFEHVIEALGVPPGEILFLDDNRINVEGARAMGLDAEVVRGPGEARHLLVARGLL